MQKTQHYELKKPEITDPLRVADFNENSDLIDAALAANAKALSDYKTANDAVVAKKAAQSAVSALEQSTNTALAALSAAVGTTGQNARIVWGSYTGNETYGEDNPTSLTFDFCPVLVVVTCTLYTNKGTQPSIMVRPSGKAFPETDITTGVHLSLTWSDNGVSWYAVYPYSSSRTPCGKDQLNNSGTTYYYAAIGYDLTAQE